MIQGFDEWCKDRVCRGCRYGNVGNMDDCKRAYEEDMRNFGLNSLQSIEKKLDAIIKHFNISVDEEINI